MTHDPHVNYSPDWRTPMPWVEWVRRTMGGAIDLDPCADPERPIATENWSEDALDRQWTGRVYCNPPGANSAKSIKPWWEHAQSQRWERLVWCFFNCEATRSVDPCPLAFGYLVIPRRRIAFDHPTRKVKSPRNWAWFWSSHHPDDRTPIESVIVPLGRSVKFTKEIA